MMKKIAVVGLCLFAGSALFAQNGLGSTFDFIERIESELPGDVNRASRYSKIKVNEWKAGNYSAAIDALNEAMKENHDFTLASGYVQLAMLNWNLGNKYAAREAMEKAIHVLRTKKYVSGSGCEECAVIFYNKMKNDDLPAIFTYRDTEKGGVLWHIMQVPYAVFEKKIGEEKRRLDFLNSYYQSQLNTEYRRGQSQARMAKMRARQEYQNSTGRTFSPNNPPSYGSSAREAWDACKKVYDIFGE